VNPVSYFRHWLRRRKRKRTHKSLATTLREFVYLDEISVYSLLASRFGAIATEFTKTEAATLQTEAAGTVSGNIGVAKGESTAHLLKSRSQSSQVLRKSIVQTSFKELYDFELPHLLIGPISEDAQPPERRSQEEYIDACKSADKERWIRDSDDLQRGSLLELEVQLEADPFFRVSAVISSFLDIFEEGHEAFSEIPKDQVRQFRFADKMLAKLLAGLVPIRGLAVDYSVVTHAGKELLVHHRALEKLPTEIATTALPLYVVCVAEQSLFWKDIRRILFSNSRYRMLCRIADSGLQRTWTPVKLVNVLKSVSPELSEQFETASSKMLQAMSTRAKSEPGQNDRCAQVKDVLRRYASILPERHGKHADAMLFESMDLDLDSIVKHFGDLERRRKAFDLVTERVINHYQFEKDALACAECRSIALADAGLDFTVFHAREKPVKSPDSSPSEKARFVDAEVIAVYW
jgi:hypothetical protein